LSNRFSRTSRLAQRKRSGSASEVVAEAVQEWITAIGAKTAYIERGSPWESGYIENFNARLRDELLKGTQS
jgi:putative transposase